MDRSVDSEVLCFDRDLRFLNYTMFSCIYVSVHKVMKMYFVLQGESSPFFVQEFLLQDLRKLFSP